MKKKLHRSTFFLAAILFFGNIFSQSRVFVEIQKSKTKYPDKNFHIHKVIDAREIRDNIGFIYKADLSKKYQTDFKKELSDEFYKFFNEVYPNPYAANNIVMVVNVFEIGHELKEETKDLGSAYGNFDFYLLLGDSCYLITHFEKKIEEEAPDLTRTHPNRIKRLLLFSGAELEQKLEKFRPIPDKKILFDSLLVKGKPGLNANALQQDKNYSPKFYFFQAGTYYSFSSSVLLFGINSSLVLQVKSHPKYLVGANVNLLLFGQQTKQSLTAAKSYQVFNVDVGVKMLKQVHKYFFINLNPQLILGKTELISQANTIPNPQAGNVDHSEKLTGVEVDVGAYVIPPKLPGLYSGLNVFYRETNSNLYDVGFGLKLDFGYRF